MGWQLVMDKPNKKKFVLANHEKIFYVELTIEADISSLTLFVPPSAYHMIEQQFKTHPEFSPSSKHRLIYNKFDNYSCSLSIPKIENEIIVRFLNELIQFEPYIEQIQLDILAFFKLQEPSAIKDEIKKMIDLEGFKATLLFVKALYKKGYRHAFHYLADLCFQEGQIDDGLQSLKLVPNEDKKGQFTSANLCNALLEKNYDK